MNRDSFIFYRSFYEGIKELPRDIQGEVLTAIMEYGINGETTENLKPIAKAIFTLIKPQIDANNKKFENGQKGGRPPKNETKKKPKQNQDETKPKPNGNVNDNVNVNVNVNEKDFKKVAFEKCSPTPDQIKTFEKFLEYWTEKNTNGRKMKFEKQKTFDVSRRWATWLSNDREWKKEKSSGKKEKTFATNR